MFSNVSGPSHTMTSLFEIITIILVKARKQFNDYSRKNRFHLLHSFVEHV